MLNLELKPRGQRLSCLEIWLDLSKLYLIFLCQKDKLKAAYIIKTLYIDTEKRGKNL